MTLKEFREAYEEKSTKASEINRSSVYAGIAATWVIKGDDAALPTLLRITLVFFCLSLLADAIQYVYQALCIYCHYEKQRKEGKKETDEGTELGLNVYAFWTIWGMKFIMSIIAVILLGCYVAFN